VLESKPFSQLVVARLSEFFAEKTAWFRGLWDVGTILSLKELLEIAPLSPAVISQEALDWMAKDVASIVTKDEGLPRRTQLEVRNLLEGGLLPGALAALATLVREVEGQYLKLWATAIAQPGTPKVSVERSARAIATYLLGAGFSQAFLHRWLTYHVEHSPTVYALGQLVLEVDSLVQARQRSFSVFVPMNGALDPQEAPPEAGTGPVGWLCLSFPQITEHSRMVKFWPLRAQYLGDICVQGCNLRTGYAGGQNYCSRNSHNHRGGSPP
jgi:hypothetical protein